jgi:hypothetical protein
MIFSNKIVSLSISVLYQITSANSAPERGQLCKQPATLLLLAILAATTKNGLY